MSSQGNSADGSGTAGLDLKQQFPALSEMLRALNSARKQCSMYGGDHPNSREALAQFTDCIDALVATIGGATCVFTKSSLIVNDSQYAPTDTNDLYQRLRVRGVLGLTFLAGVSPEQALAFLAFLNVEPSEVKQQGGPSIYLRKHGVSRIVVTEQVYELDDDADQAEAAPPGREDIDRVLGLALQWLLKQDEDADDEPMPVLPIGDILADPDAAAKLIREAVTKLHSSRTPKQEMRTLSHEVVSELKTLSGLDHAAWDQATPQVRKAMSKLPSEMRPDTGGFVTAPQTEEEKDFQRAWNAADVAQVEALLNAAATRSGSEDAEPAVTDLQQYFDAGPSGIMPGWQDELGSSALASSSASTLTTLLAWEQSPTEHGRLASALASMLDRSVESDDMETAAQCAAELAEEALLPDKSSWRVVNARMAFQSVEPTALQRLALHALDARNVPLAAAVVEANPALAIAMADLLGVKGGDEFAAALQRGLAASGSAGVACLGRLLRSGLPSQAQMALGLLVEMPDCKALPEITEALKTADDSLIISALAAMQNPLLLNAAEAVLGLLSHGSAEVRCAALQALGRMGDPELLPHLFRKARGRLVGGPALPEQIAAIEAIGMIDHELSREFLTKVAARRPILGRARAAQIRAAANSALDSMKHIRDAGDRIAA